MLHSLRAARRALLLTTPRRGNFKSITSSLRSVRAPLIICLPGGCIRGWQPSIATLLITNVGIRWMIPNGGRYLQSLVSSSTMSPVATPCNADVNVSPPLVKKQPPPPTPPPSRPPPRGAMPLQCYTTHRWFC